MTRTMTGVALLCIALSSSAALAQGRPSSTQMTCNQAQRLVQSQGAIVLGTGGYTFDRFVANRSFCPITDVNRTSFAPTRDDPHCFVGYRCLPPNGQYIGDDL